MDFAEKMGMSCKSGNQCSWLQHEWILANFSGLRSGFYYIILCDWQRSWSRTWKDKVATKKWPTPELLSRSRVNLYYMASLISVETPKSYYATNFLLFSQCLIFTFPFGLAKFPSPILLPFLNSPLLHAIRPGIVSLSIETFFLIHWHKFGHLDKGRCPVRYMVYWLNSLLNLLRRLRIHLWFDCLKSALHIHNQPNRFVHFALQMLYKICICSNLSLRLTKTQF